MMGMGENGGAIVDGLEHARQSMRRVVRTPRGSVRMLPEYGSIVHRLIDRPLTPATQLAVIAATAEAIDRWVPTVRVRRVRWVSAYASGRADLEVQFVYRPTGRVLTVGVTA